MYPSFKKEIKILFIVAIVSVIIAIGGILLLKMMQPAVPPEPSVGEKEQGEVLPQKGIKTDNVELVLLELLVLPAEERDEYKFKRDDGVTYELNVNIFDQARDGVIRGELYIYDEKQGEWQKHEFVDPINDPQFLYTSEEGQMGDPLRSHIRFKSEIPQTASEEERMRLVFYDYPIGCEGDHFVTNKEYCLQQRVEIASQEFLVAAAASTIDTSAWKTYRSGELGFELKYPSTWSVRENNTASYHFVSFIPSDVKENDPTGEIGIMVENETSFVETSSDAVEIFYAFLDSCSPETPSSCDEKTRDVYKFNGRIIVAGALAFQTSGGCCLDIGRHIFLYNKDNRYRITLYVDSLPKSTWKNEDVFNQILATFRFVE